MKILAAVLLVSCLFLTLTSYIYRVNAPPVVASLDIHHQGDLIIAGNNVTTINGLFNINGSIIATENATLILNNAVLNLTQTINRQFNITLENPINGNPRLLAYNSSITSALDFLVYLNDNSTATINNSTVPNYVMANDYSTLTVLNSSHIGKPRGLGFSNITVYNSTMSEWHNYDSPRVEVHDSTISNLVIGSTSVNCTISNLKPGNMSYWNFLTNCSVVFLAGGMCPNITFVNTRVDLWRFAFYVASNAIITDSNLGEISAATGSSTVNLTKSTVSHTYCAASSTLWIDSSTINLLEALHSSTAWLLNTTCNAFSVHGSAHIYVNWNLDVHVVDSIGQDIPYANVTVTYSNTTIADSKLTDNYGWAKFTLMEKMINTTAHYPLGNYTVEAAYLTHSNSTTANMTENKQIELAFEDFVVPEFSPSLLIPLFMIATLLATILYRKKNAVKISQ